MALQQRAAAAGGSEAVASDGGFLVAAEFQQEILRRVYQTGQIFNRCQQFTTTRPAFKFPQFDESSRATGSRLGGVTVYNQNEADAAIASKAKFSLAEVAIHKLIGLVYCSDEMAQDTDAFATWATYSFAEEMKFRIEDWTVNGTGAGEPLGVTASPATITVAKESGQGSATVVSANVQNMSARLWSASRPNACWLFNQGFRGSLTTLQTTVGAAGSVNMLWSSADGVDRLDGIPAYESEYCAAAGSQGDLILADFSRYAIVIRELMRSELSVHVRWLTDESTFRFVTRIGGQTIDARPVTPKNGSNTTSPFVCLAARP
jgi:HK97 family phage major capsid protein